MQHCATCAFWKPIGPDIDTWDLKPPVGECVYAGRDENSLAIVTCQHEGIGGELLTNGRFGCVMHEPRIESSEQLSPAQA